MLRPTEREKETTKYLYAPNEQSRETRYNASIMEEVIVILQ
jgi:hypothetical protein